MNNLNKTLLLLILFSTTVFYGQRKQNREKIKSLKIAFITDKLDLSTEEAEAFWPTYNQHEEKLTALRLKERTEITSKLKNADELSEKEADALLALALSIDSEKKETNLEYFKKVNTIISSKKTILLMKAEEDFKRQLIRQYRQKRSN